MTDLEQTQTLEPRSCANCACFHPVEHPFNPGTFMTVCKKNPPILAQAVAEREQMIMLDGKPVTRKDRLTGKPIMEKTTKEVFIHPATDPKSVCFDGWRPAGTLPGDKFEINDMIARYRKLFQDMQLDALSEAQRQFDDMTEKH